MPQGFPVEEIFLKTFMVDVMTVDVSSGGVMFLGKEASSKCSTEIQRVQGHKKLGLKCIYKRDMKADLLYCTNLASFRLTKSEGLC